MWLLQHESWLDFVTMPHLWKEIGKPAINGVSRTNYPPYVSSITDAMMRHTIFIPITRTSMESDASPEAKDQMRQRNEQQLQLVRAGYERGIHVALTPEGTTKSDGYMSPIKSGAYRVSHVRLPDRRVAVIPCVPVGNTYDFISGERDKKGRQKPFVYFRFGGPFFYEPLPRDGDEPDGEYIERDKAHFADRIKTALLSLNTITAAQLGCEYLLREAERGASGVRFKAFWATIRRHSETLEKIEGLVVADGITGHGRSADLYQRLYEEGFIKDMGALNRERILDEPSDLTTYRDSNILRYSAHRLCEVANHDERVREVLKAA